MQNHLKGLDITIFPSRYANQGHHSKFWAFPSDGPLIPDAMLYESTTKGDQDGDHVVIIEAVSWHDCRTCCSFKQCCALTAPNDTVLRHLMYQVSNSKNGIYRGPENVSHRRYREAALDRVYAGAARQEETVGYIQSAPSLVGVISNMDFGRTPAAAAAGRGSSYLVLAL